MIHKLKTVNPFFQDVWEGRKTFEVRRFDRAFRRWDLLHLCEYDADRDLYTGRGLYAQISYVLTSDDYPDGLMPGFCILGLTCVSFASLDTQDPGMVAIDE